MEENENIKREIQTLKNKIWTTYRVRIKSAERLLNEAKFLEHMSAYYSISLAVFSVIGLVYDDKLFSLINVLISIALLGIVYYGNSMNLKDRHNSMKDNYLSVEKIYYELTIKEGKMDYLELKKIYDDYNMILNKVENHTIYDYISYIIEEKQKGNEINFNFLNENKNKYYMHNAKNYFLRFFVIIVPTIVSIQAAVIMIR